MTALSLEEMAELEWARLPSVPAIREDEPGTNRNRRLPAPIIPPVVCTCAGLLAMDLPPREMLLSPWLESQSLSMIYAWRGVGKTHVALGIGYALASGSSFLTWSAPAPVPVLYIDGEMPGAALRDRVARIVASNEREAAEDHLRFITPDLQPDGIMPNLATFEGQEAIEAVLGDAKVIIVDNLSCLVRGAKENEADGWLPVADWALRMRATGRSVLFIHHAGKGGQQRGTSKREDILDAVLLLKRPADYQPTEGARFEVHFEKARSLFGQEVDPLDVKLETDAAGLATWTTQAASRSTETQMIELAQMGLGQADIARELGCNRSTVLRALRKAETEGRYRATTKARKSSPAMQWGDNE